MTTAEFNYGFQKSQDAEFPILVQIALMHYICNSNCSRCPVGLSKRGEMGVDQKGEFDPKKRCFFPFGLFPKIADEVAQHPGSILRFHGRGEPLLHPHFVEMVAYANRVGVGCITSFTNAIALDDAMANSLLDAGIDLLELSIDAYSEDLYRKFRGTDHFRQVVSNGENLIRKRNRRQSSTRVIVSAVDDPELKGEKEQFRQFWEERADQVIFRSYHTYGGRLQPLVRISTKTKPVPCAQLWSRFSVNPWGQINACFNDWADQEVVGDLNEAGSTIAQIWRDSGFTAARTASTSGKCALSCCQYCRATQEGWTHSYQLLIDKLFSHPPNFSFV